jgi:hypothetical protein
MSNDDYIMEQIERIHREVAQNIAQFEQFNAETEQYQMQQQNQQMIEQQQIQIQMQNQQMINDHLQFQQQMLMNPFGF